MRLTKTCPLCQKPLELKSETTLGTETLQFYKCGHVFSKTQIETSEDLDFTSLDGSGHIARDYQKDGIRFGIDAIQNRGGFILADQMRLGKTPQALLIVKNLDQFPVLILVRAANIYQWVRETKKWCKPLPNGVWVIDGTKDWIPPGFDIYLISMDTFSRRGTCKSCKHQFHDEECTRCDKKNLSCRVCLPAGDAMSTRLLEFGFKVCIVDEAHSMKNTDSQRSIALTSFLKEIERSSLVQEVDFSCPNCNNKWQEQVEVKIDSSQDELRVRKTSHCEKCSCVVSVEAVKQIKVTRQCALVMLTGTAIKNRADEYSVPLNLIAPDRFPSLGNLRKRWLIQDGKGRYSRVHPKLIDAFKKEIAPFVLRREKEDIYKELPTMQRLFTTITIEDERLKKAYNKVLGELEASMAGKHGTFFDSIGMLQQLRQICGLAKVPFVSDYAETFVADSERSKLAIGYHHLSVRDNLQRNLEGFGVCKLDGADSPQRKDYVAHKYFETAPEQIILLGEQACKEGMELVYIENVLVTERQWSSAEEEQFEYRFYNPDLEYLKRRGLENKKTIIEYILAKGTIDQFFYEMVEEKRAIFGETIANNWSLDTDSGSFSQLLERTVAGRL